MLKTIFPHQTETMIFTVSKLICIDISTIWLIFTWYHIGTKICGAHYVSKMGVQAEKKSVSLFRQWLYDPVRLFK